jgi:hypothetical protein
MHPDFGGLLATQISLSERKERNKINRMKKSIKAGTMRCSSSALTVGVERRSTGGRQENYDWASRKGKR